MPIPQYGVLVGKASDRRLATPQKNHYEIRIEAAGESYRIAFNVQSADGSEVLYAVHDPFVHPLTAALAAVTPGHHDIASAPGGLAIDFTRGHFVDRDEMKPIPLTAPGTDNDLNDILDRHVRRAMDGEGTVYAFGSFFLDPGKKDPYFNFKPGQGIHDVHFNQGNSGKFQKDDGIFQDGALLFRFADRWVGLFIAFQNQSWTTDAQGHATGVVPGTGTTPGTGTVPTPQPAVGVRIVAAVANSVGTPDVETVTLLNASPEEVSLAGWSIADRMKRRLPLDGKIAPGDSVRITLKEPVALANDGGSITLIDRDNKIVDGVSYTKEQASHPGWTIVF